jgi:transcription initiation factor TFIID subunit TAF12
MFLMNSSQAAAAAAALKHRLLEEAKNAKVAEVLVPKVVNIIEPQVKEAEMYHHEVEAQKKQEELKRVQEEQKAQRYLEELNRAQEEEKVKQAKLAAEHASSAKHVEVHDVVQEIAKFVPSIEENKTKQQRVQEEKQKAAKLQSGQKKTTDEWQIELDEKTKKR